MSWRIYSKNYYYIWWIFAPWCPVQVFKNEDGNIITRMCLTEKQTWKITKSPRKEKSLREKEEREQNEDKLSQCSRDKEGIAAFLWQEQRRNASRRLVSGQKSYVTTWTTSTSTTFEGGETPSSRRHIFSFRRASPTILSKSSCVVNDGCQTSHIRLLRAEIDTTKRTMEPLSSPRTMHRFMQLDTVTDAVMTGAYRRTFEFNRWSIPFDTSCQSIRLLLYWPRK